MVLQQTGDATEQDQHKFDEPVHLYSLIPEEICLICSYNHSGGPPPPLAQPGLVSLFLFLSSSWREDRKAAAATITCLFFGFSGRCPSQPGPKAALHPHPTHTLHTTIDAAPNIRRRSQERGLLGASSLLLLHHLHIQTLSYNNLCQPLSSTLFISCSTLSTCSWETEKAAYYCCTVLTCPSVFRSSRPCLVSSPVKSRPLAPALAGPGFLRHCCYIHAVPSIPTLP